MTVTAPQALSLFNSQFAHENSLHLAKRVREHSGDVRQRVERLFWLALSRAPTDTEAETCLSFLQQKRKSYADEAAGTEDGAETQIDHELLALRDLSLAIINTNEFLYLD